MDKIAKLDDFLLQKLAHRKIKKTPTGYKSWCPFPEHPNHSYTFSISISKGIAKCFSCGRTRSLFQFLLDLGADLDFAVEFITPDADVRREPEIKIFEKYILGTYLPKSLLDRGFKIETLQHFQVGYDIYNHRITIPLYFDGNLVGVAFRQYPKRFWFSEGFKRAYFIYNYAPTDVRYYVEGFTDTWRAWEFGTKNVSATLGVNVSEFQLQLMKRHKTVVLAFDRDLAGYQWAFYVYERLKRDIEVKFAVFNCWIDGKNDVGNCTEKQWRQHKIIDFFEFETFFIQNFPNFYVKIQEELKKILKNFYN